MSKMYIKILFICLIYKLRRIYMRMSRLTHRAAIILTALFALFSQTVVSYASTPSQWARSAVDEAISMGIVPNSLNGAYQNAITRAEFCALAVSLYEQVKGDITRLSPAFVDTNDTNVRKMAALDIASGIGNNRFDPGGRLTREQAAVILARLINALGKPLAESAPAFADNAQISGWAAAAVGKVQANGVMSGVGNNRFDPQGAYTREQSIFTIMKVWNLVKQAAPAVFAFPYKFSTQDIYGNQVTGAALGEKQLFFVHYWSITCGPCINEMPDLAKLAEEYGDRVGFIGLLDSYSINNKDVTIRVIEASGVTFPMVDARHGELNELAKLAITGYLPTTILIDSGGNIVGDQIIGAYGSNYYYLIDNALKKLSD